MVYVLVLAPAGVLVLAKVWARAVGIPGSVLAYICTQLRIVVIYINTEMPK
jgi:hypothetical protein